MVCIEVFDCEEQMYYILQLETTISGPFQNSKAIYYKLGAPVDGLVTSQPREFPVTQQVDSKTTLRKLTLSHLKISEKGRGRLE